MMRTSRFASISAVALVAAVGFVLSPFESAAEERLGWHDEVMPEGLSRGEKQGEYVWAKDGSVMVYVPAGTFPMGSNDGQSDEAPVHQVYLDAYYIDKFEVTWRQWKDSGLPYRVSPLSRHPEPKAPDWGIVDEQPVTYVDWSFAKKYTDLMGKRLPTEAEWEKAARGTDGRLYPWGNEPPTFDRAVWRDHPTAKEMLEVVDCCEEGASPYGAVNMAGNVYEWCEDLYHAGYYAESPENNPVNREKGYERVLRGGAFPLEVEDLTTTLRYPLMPEDQTSYIGFRAVLPAIQ
jgi:formylglycine-generating enzyme required for sulfatase activity